MKNFALIGASGYIAPRHMRAIKETSNLLSLAYDTNDSVGQIDSVFPDALFFTEFENFYEQVHVLARDVKTKLDYFSVCSPNYLHQAHTAAGLRAGSDVICEKPLVSNTRQLDELRQVQQETDKRVYTILQLRNHQAIMELREHIKNSSTRAKAEVDLTYVTSRGNWYNSSWKSDPRKGFGIAANIGVHFFDMLGYVFGDLLGFELHLVKEKKMAGRLNFKKGNVKWFLSIDKEDLPESCSDGRTTYRNINVNGNSLEFTHGFTDLHTKSYEEILNGNGWGLEDVRPSIELVQSINLSASQNNPSLFPNVILK